MATYNVLADEAPYYTIKVEFNGYEFEQRIVSPLKGAELDAMLQGYADDYEAAYVPPPVIEVDETAE